MLYCYTVMPLYCYTVILLYRSLILFILIYGWEIWENLYKSQLRTLMLLQKKAIRNIAKASYLDHTHSLFVQYVFEIFRYWKIKNLHYNL